MNKDTANRPAAMRKATEIVKDAYERYLYTSKLNWTSKFAK